jgi:hypothetical protein
MDLPERSFVEGVGQFQQAFTDQKEKIPCDENAKRALDEAKNLRERKALRQRLVRELFKASCADGAVFMLGDAFATEELFAFRTACHGFAHGMIETTLMSEGLHD